MLQARVVITPEASEIVAQLKEKYGPLMFHQSGGCCDGSQPMCFERGDFKVGHSDVCLGWIDDCAFWMSKDQFEYWKYTLLTIDISKGRGSSFSLEIPLGVRFMTHSRMFTEEELGRLEPLTYIEE
ncbi:MAG: UDP-glucose 4-epimerase [Bacteroidetes bacterium B1(2017)]|nr:MAG: UDP-glucose 4-epimerase [Bacteroidetes bacterium B1(2017)]